MLEIKGALCNLQEKESSNLQDNIYWGICQRNSSTTITYFHEPRRKTGQYYYLTAVTAGGADNYGVL
jgi:hypothetical protein